MKHSIRWISAITVFFAALQLTACAPPPATLGKVAPSKLEPIEGSTLKRVVLTEKAAQRLDIQTTGVRISQSDQMRTIGAKVVDRPTKPAGAATLAAGAAVEAQAADLSRVWVRVNLTESELNQVDRSQPVHVLPILVDDEEEGDEEMDFEAELDDDIDDMDDADETGRPAGSTSLFYAVDNKDNALALGQPVFVKLALVGSGAERKVVPFAALLYDVKGKTWVYINPEPLTFVRAPVTVDYIDDNLVFLSDGPPLDTKVVTVGSSLLYGAETGVSK